MLYRSQKNKVSSSPRIQLRRGMKGIAVGVVLAMMMGVSGCAYEVEEPETESVNSITQKWGGDYKNGIPPAVLASNYLAQANTDASGVTSPIHPDLIELCDSFDGKQCILKAQWEHWINPNQTNPPDNHTILRGRIVEALIEGAMPEGVFVLVGGKINIEGMFGMYPGWATSRLGLQEQQTMSAFVAVKVNAFGAAVPIGIVGPGPGPEATKPVENQSFTYQEAAFYGNLFGAQPSKMMACVGARNSGGGTVAGLADRICSDPGNPCNIVGLGSCAAWCDVWGGVGLPTGEYCAVAKDPMGAKWQHPVTVYMRVDP